jgi:uncharacterized repeat protein (TIGR03833 family)
MDSGSKGYQRSDIRVGSTVDIIKKEDQRSGKKTRGVVQEILTRSSYHPHGIKVRLRGNRVGRVTAVIDTSAETDSEKGH